MLVLTRKKGQSIIVGGNIKIYVTEVTGETVRLGIEAPLDVEIYRSEVYQSLKSENKISVTSPDQIKELLKIKK